MSGLLLLVISSAILLAGYFVYGKWLERTWKINPEKATPAFEYEDGVDYVPAKKGVVFGHQFASIAGAGPINGPIIAAMFGWVPVVLWILVGGIFIGAVHDFAALYASVNNKGRTIGYIIELYIGKLGKRLFLFFVWLFSILVVAAFADIVAGTFNGFDEQGQQVISNGSVATTSILFIAAAVGLGFFLKNVKPTNLVSTIVAIALLVLCIIIGLTFPLYVTKQIWMYFVFIYIFIASISPVWALLQPRDYLNSFLLILMMAGAFLGILFANPTMNLKAFSGFEVNGQFLFPILFVTIACGAISGFHSLVASGTTSKQIENQKDMLPISFGSMLLECLLAIISVIAVGALTINGNLPEGTPPVIFAKAVSQFLTAIGLPTNATYTIITLAISAFALTSLDSVARVGRLSFQEIFIDDNDTQVSPIKKILSNKYFATAITLLMGYLLALVGYQNIWPLFGSANQLLAALALVACSVFLKGTNRKGWMLYVPMVFMTIVTFTSLVMGILNIINKLSSPEFAFASDGLQLIFAVLLLGLGVVVAIQGVKKLVEVKKEA